MASDKGQEGEGRGGDLEGLGLAHREYLQSLAEAYWAGQSRCWDAQRKFTSALREPPPDLRRRFTEATSPVDVLQAYAAWQGHAQQAFREYVSDCRSAQDDVERTTAEATGSYLRRLQDIWASVDADAVNAPTLAALAEAALAAGTFRARFSASSQSR